VSEVVHGYILGSVQVSVDGKFSLSVTLHYSMEQFDVHPERQRCHSKTAVSRHLGYYRTGNSAIRSADPENPSLEPNMEWIGCTVCEIFAFKLYCDGVTLRLGFGVTQGHRKWYYSIEHIRHYIRLP